MNNNYQLPAHLAYVKNLNAKITASLSNSCAQALSVAELCHIAGQDFSQLAQTSLSYAPLDGSEALRAKIANFHQVLNHHQYQLSAENVLTFCGAQEALAAIYQSILVAGDEVVVVTPCYPSLTVMAEKLGCKIKTILLSEARQWQLTIDDFVQVVTEKTKLIVINSPHNPSGQVIDAGLAEQILQLAQRHQSYLLADDVAQASNYNQLDLSHRFLDYDKALVVSVMSKSFGLAGVRIGWAVTQNTRLLNALLAVKSYGSICCSALDEQLAMLALAHDKTIIEQQNCLIAHNIKQFTAFVTAHKEMFSWHPPQAGILALVKINTDVALEYWLAQLAQHTGILLLPSSLFGLEGPYVRVGFGQADFQSLLSKLGQFVNKVD